MFKLSSYFVNKKERERLKNRRGRRNSYDDAVEHEVKRVKFISYVSRPKLQHMLSNTHNRLFRTTMKKSKRKSTTNLLNPTWKNAWFSWNGFWLNLFDFIERNYICVFYVCVCWLVINPCLKISINSFLRLREFRPFCLSYSKTEYG